MQVLPGSVHAFVLGISLFDLLCPWLLCCSHSIPDTSRKSSGDRFLKESKCLKRQKITLEFSLHIQVPKYLQKSEVSSLKLQFLTPYQYENPGSCPEETHLNELGREENNSTYIQAIVEQIRPKVIQIKPKVLQKCVLTVTNLKKKKTFKCMLFKLFILQVGLVEFSGFLRPNI